MLLDLVNRRNILLSSILALLLTIGLVQPTLPTASAKPNAEPALPTDLALVPADALGFVHVRMADVWKNDAMKDYRKIIENAGPAALATLDEQFVPKPSTLERITAVVLPMDPNKPEPLVVAILTFSAPYEAEKVRSAYLPNAKLQRVGGKEFFTDEKTHAGISFPNDRTLVISDDKTMSQFLSAPAKSEGGMTNAIRLAASGKAMVAAVNMKKIPFPPGFKDQIPPDIHPLLEAENMTVSMELGKDATLDARLTYSTLEDTIAAEKALKKAAEMGRTLLAQQRREFDRMLNKKNEKGGARPLEELPEALGAVAALGALNTVDEILADLPVKRENHTLVGTVTLPGWTTQYVGLTALATGLALPAVQKVRASAQVSMSTNNLKQLALTMHNHEAAYGAMPAAAITDKKGKRLLSWRVAILPFIEQDNLYKQFKLDEPWDSEHNKKLIGMMPKVFSDPRLPDEPGKTYYKVFVGKDAGFDWVKPRRFPADFPDGTSNTIMIAAAGDPVIWTKPEDFEFDAEMKLPDLTKPFGQLIVAMFDGSVRTLQPKISETTLKNAINRQDGQVLGDDF